MEVLGEGPSAGWGSSCLSLPPHCPETQRTWGTACSPPSLPLASGPWAATESGPRLALGARRSVGPRRAGSAETGLGFQGSTPGRPAPTSPAHPAQCQALARGSSSVLGGGREARALSLVPGLSQQDKRGMSSGHKPCARCRRRMAWAAPRAGKPRRRPRAPPAPRLPGPAAPVSMGRGRHGAVAWTARPSHARGLAG